MTTASQLETTQRKANAPSPVAVLRSLMPNRSLSFAEACRIAELQAHAPDVLIDQLCRPEAE